MDNRPRGDVGGVFEAYTAALNTMTMDEIPFIIDEAELFDQDMLWNTLDLPGAVAFRATLANARPLRGESVNQRAEKARATANTRGEAVDKFHESMVEYHPDPQNTHDSSVNGDLRNTLARIDRTYTGSIDALREVTDSVKDNPMAQRTLDTMMRSNANIMSFGMNELQILERVWERSYAPGNENARDNMQLAVVTALADSVENGIVTCANGRVSRVLGSLATLDYDPAVGSAQTTEAYKNQIYREVKISLEDALDELRGSGRLPTVVESYDSGKPADGAEETQWHAIMEARVDTILSAYSDRIPPTQLMSLRSDCEHYIKN
jgi:hypothetical protein